MTHLTEEGAETKKKWGDFKDHLARISHDQTLHRNDDHDQIEDFIGYSVAFGIQDQWTRHWKPRQAQGKNYSYSEVHVDDYYYTPSWYMTSHDGDVVQERIVFHDRFGRMVRQSRTTFRSTRPAPSSSTRSVNSSKSSRSSGGPSGGGGSMGFD
jgi:uncharacterized membrane protein